MHNSVSPKVALLVDTSTAWGRSIVSGVISYANRYGSWDIRLKACGTNEQLRLPGDSKIDGVIARVISEELATHLIDSKVKIVNVSGTDFGQELPTVTYDNHAIVDVAFHYLLSCGIQSFGYVGAPGRSYSLQRERSYIDLCHSQGFECVAFPTPEAPTESDHYRESLKAWLSQLPCPTGIFTWGVERGIDVINSAHSVGLKVPDQIAVLGSEDDDLICRAVRPSLSGIKFHAERIGYEAAHMLDAQLNGNRLQNKSILYKPAGVTARASTDIYNVQDQDVAAAVRYIRANIGTPLKLADVAQAVSTAPRSLQRAFQKELRRSFSEEVAATRVEYTKQMLSESDDPIPKIAQLCGYGSPEYMATLFRKATGVTPRTYRQQVRGD